ncbi:ImmA/IrrE family metallo-endopeptidase [Arthrobacter sp. KBS0703]|uniref:ImmA/IrrE family metallo-endopeptidase n=1 Tax=Arthrobacter sp. KBS0703 TaxID=1955698 RepID=UPI0009C65821|nr:ImmA/IrrE family metallo-endopeptidase [Arthrobacter sp. KBS0703]
MSTYFEGDTDYAVAPGEFIRDWIDENEVSQAWLARQLGVSRKHVSMLLSGARLTEDVAMKLELVTGIPSRIWLGYEATYRADVARLALMEELASERALAELFPLRELRALKVVTARITNPGAVLLELMALFRVGSVSALRQCTLSPAAAYRQGTAHEVDPAAVSTWLRLCEIESESQGTALAGYDREGLESLVPELRALSMTPPDHFGAKLREQLAEVGVELVYVPEIKGARAYGATRWIGGRPVICLTLRGATDGNFWFTLFHEIGHVLIHPHNEVFIQSKDEGTNSKAEEEANVYAGSILIPESHEAELAGLRSKADVVRFASRIGVSPGVVVGRLWHDGLWPYTNGHQLCMRLRIAVDD